MSIPSTAGQLQQRRHRPAYRHRPRLPGGRVVRVPGSLGLRSQDRIRRIGGQRRSTDGGTCADSRWPGAVFGGCFVAGLSCRCRCQEGRSVELCRGATFLDGASGRRSNGKLRSIRACRYRRGLVLWVKVFGTEGPRPIARSSAGRVGVVLAAAAGGEGRFLALSQGPHAGPCW